MHQAKKLALVSATSVPVTDGSEEVVRVPCIQYSVWFQEEQVKTLFDSGSKVNAINPDFARKLGLKVWKTNVGAQKIDGSALKTFGMVIADFQVEDKTNRPRFFQETFLVANTKFEVILGMPFLKISNADMSFGKGTLTWKTYTINKALPTTEQVQIIDKKDFIIAALDANSETFVVHVAIREREKMPVHSKKQAQIEAQVGALLFNKAPTEVPAEYSDYSNVFLAEHTAELLENTGINEHAIKLEEGKQPLFGPIYTLGPVELETLKTYIETNLANGFIRLSKSPARAPILFNRKPDRSLRLCVDYRGFNNLTIKNRYLLPLIGESLDRLGRAKQFTQLNLTNAYHRMRICESDEWKTAFRTRYGHFKYQVMPFGLSNAPATFQGYVNKILAEKLDIFVVVYLDDILIYTKDPGQPHIEAVCWVLDQLRKHSLFANLKKCCFHQDEVRFLGYVVSSKGISMEAERIEVVKDWPEPKSVRDIQVFLGFANFYRRFIQGFSRIAAPLTSILKTTGSPDEPAPSRNNGSRSASSRNDNSRPASGKNDGNGEVDGIGVGKNGVEHAKKSEKTSKSWKLSKSGKRLSKSRNSTNSDATEDGSKFLTPDARTAFNCLRLAFTEAPIFRHFDPECHIRIETDALGYAIGGVLSQLTSGTNPNGIVTKADLGQWHPVAFFSRKMIPAETRYETHDGKLLAIVEAFKTWRHYLEGCKHKMLVLTDHNNLCRFMDTKSLSSRQVRWAQELSRYHFRINYR